MGLFSRLKMGFLLSFASLRVLRSHPKLLVYPLLSGLASIVFIVALFGPLLLASSALGGLEAAGLFVVYLGTTFIAALFNAALVHSVRTVFHGEQPSIRAGLEAALGHTKALLVWALASAIVGIVIQSLESRGGVGAQIAAVVFSVGWTVATFFVVPVIVFEDASPRSMFTRSASIFKDTWGETAGANVGLNVIPALIAIAGIALAVVVGVVIPTAASIVTAVVIAIGAVVAAVLVGGVITGVAKTALYVYATESIEPEAFRSFDFESLFEADDSSQTQSLGGIRRGI
ncbi:DUF6159 family protein [Natronobiforma cellulositropha]|uniref:DUF6159 family protein n=1 Tax=Natronobiforma cellulositropha TaxID=1679076 RepID=UPI0021D56A3B|nr:DUF6159 family protein [Natronobiforma cellulositropha]